MTKDTRALGDLSSPDIPKRLSRSSVLCLPLGAVEQHGPHLPLNTDLVIVENIARLMTERLGDEFDLWRLPAIPVGLSREHAWAPGTLSLNVQSFTALLRDLAADLARSLPARNLVIVNGHGGNRGILDALIHEFQADFGFNVCVIHPIVLSGMEEDCPFPDIHGGMIETSLMLMFAPHLVRKDAFATLTKRPDPKAIERVILDLGVSWPWSSGDRALADQGVTGEAAAASAKFGEQVVESLLKNVRGVLTELRERGAR
ncbi:MAG: creatininase family protein [Pseudorhodoplanes sp.]|nr:creatininase family protein [Pseudorhodoplanes sp.]